jgi:glutaconate CoA-transferase subunit B
MTDIMALLQQGTVDVGFIGGAQMDRFGNLNTSYIFSRSEDQAAGPPSRGTKLPGSGGAADIAALAHRLLIIIEHERRRFVPRVDYVTSPGYGEGGDWRSRVGLPRGGPSAAITTLGVLRFDPETREAYLDSYHPGGSSEEVQTHTGWDLRVADRVRETPPPTADELRIIREYDPQGFWTR